MIHVLLFFVLVNVGISTQVFASQASEAELARLRRMVSLRVAPLGGPVVEAEEEFEEEPEEKLNAAGEGQVVNNNLNQELLGAFANRRKAVAKIKSLFSGNEVPNIDAKDEGTGVTALIKAVREKNDAAVKEILSHGANANIQDSTGRTAIMYAIEMGVDRRTVELLVDALINAGANLDIQDNNGDSALLKLAKAAGGTRWYENIAMKLLKAGANINLLDANGRSVADYAKIYRKIQNTLQKYAQLKEALEPEEKKINAAFNVKPVEEPEEFKAVDEKIRAALEKPVSINKTSLMDAIMLEGVKMNDAVRLVKEALAEGATVHSRDDMQRTPLMLAAMGETPIYFNHKNYTSQAAEIINILIRAGSDINAKDRDGVTALMLAVASANPDVTRRLLNAGADITLRDAEGNNVLDVAKIVSKQFHDKNSSNQVTKNLNLIITMLKNKLAMQKYRKV